MGDESRRRLAARLKQLRSSWDGVTVTQKQVADALSASGALVSSWENGTATPPEDRVKQYSRLFSSRRSFEGGTARLLSPDDLTADENRRQQLLADELVRLREEALDDSRPTRRTTGALGGRFFYFGDNQPITILYTPMSEAQFGLDRRPLQDSPPSVQYAANPTHPNGATLLKTGDVDALVELAAHIRAENPGSEVRWASQDGTIESDQLTGHVVLLGSGDYFGSSGLISSGSRQPASTVELFIQSAELPVSAKEYGEDTEFDFEYVVQLDKDGNPAFNGTGQEGHRPRFLRDESTEERRRVRVSGAPILEADVALIARKPNPYNLSAKVIWCSGLFSRGTYGAVRAFTDARLRTRNEQFVTERFDLDDFWMLIQVQVITGERTFTPDLALGRNRLRSSQDVSQPTSA